MANDDTVRCPRPECAHPIDMHDQTVQDGHCRAADCSCRVTPNTIALAAVQTALFGELTPAGPGPMHVARKADGSWGAKNRDGSWA